MNFQSQISSLSVNPLHTEFHFLKVFITPCMICVFTSAVARTGKLSQGFFHQISWSSWLSNCPHPVISELIVRALQQQMLLLTENCLQFSDSACDCEKCSPQPNLFHQWLQSFAYIRVSYWRSMLPDSPSASVLHTEVFILGSCYANNFGILLYEPFSEIPP